MRRCALHRRGVAGQLYGAMLQMGSQDKESLAVSRLHQKYLFRQVWGRWRERLPPSDAQGPCQGQQPQVNKLPCYENTVHLSVAGVSRQKGNGDI